VEHLAGRPARLSDERAPVVSATAFGSIWAAARLVARAWAVRAKGRRFVNVVAVFGGIDLNAQWSDELGAEPLPVLLGERSLHVSAPAFSSFKRY
jgi:hypothetical protein